MKVVLDLWERDRLADNPTSPAPFIVVATWVEPEFDADGEELLLGTEVGGIFLWFFGWSCETPVHWRIALPDVYKKMRREKERSQKATLTSEVIR